MEYGKSVSLACDTDCKGDRASKAFTVPSAPAVTIKLLLAGPAEMMLPTAPFPFALTCAAMSQAQPLLLGSHLQHNHTGEWLTTGYPDYISSGGHKLNSTWMNKYIGCSSNGTLWAMTNSAKHAMQMQGTGSHLEVTVLSTGEEAVSA